MFSASFNRLRPRLQAAMMARGDRGRGRHAPEMPQMYAMPEEEEVVGPPVQMERVRVNLTGEVPVVEVIRAPRPN